MTLRIGLVGAGPWAHRIHAPGIATHPGTRLTAVHARREEAAAEIAEWTGALVTESFEEMLPLVDAVAFAVPPSVQAPLALAAAKAGKHLILEKPLAGTVAEAEAIVDAVEAAGVASIMVFILRFAPETVSWLDEVRALGGWRAGGAKWLSGALLGGDYSSSTWRHDGGALADVGPHVFDLLDAAMGEITEVIAASRTEPDVWQILLGHESGATSTATLSMRLPMRPTITEVAVYGDNGHRALTSRTTPPESSYAVLLDDLVAMVADGRTSHPLDVRRGLHIQRLLAAVHDKLA